MTSDTVPAPASPDRNGVVRSRRRLAVAGALGLAAGLAGLVGALLRALVPEVLYEPDRRFAVGKPADFPPGSVTFLAERRLFVFNAKDGFYAVSAVCTHLGCNVNHEAGRGFTCPCHGSAFREDGRVSKGPAAWPLPHFAMSLDGRGELIVDTRRTVDPEFRTRA